jgi:hypothetical protein
MGAVVDDDADDDARGGAELLHQLQRNLKKLVNLAANAANKLFVCVVDFHC